ncbi:hypothetical protein BG32_16280 [Mesotoga sp. HF07.pep.5.2.highcov]|nr:hypothetical protein BG32_16280 [Mesotoga sp. HF07.pep.5.2.highcov]
MRFSLCTLGIIGAFGYHRKPNGQTVKTRELSDGIEKLASNCRILRADTSCWKSNPIGVYGSIRSLYKKSNKVLIALNRNGLRVVVPMLTRWSKNQNKELFFVVIGGWLPEFVAHSEARFHQMEQFSCIFVETKAMYDSLSRAGLKNVSLLSNFKSFSYVPELRFCSCKTVELRTVFFSRVVKEKGVELAIEAIEKLGKTYSITLDIFGPVADDYEKRFKALVKNCSVVNYRGVLKPQSTETYKILSQYDIMLFPTFYEGEGFPGALIDAYISGLPVIASDWKYNSEIIVEGVTGWLVPPKDVHSLEVAIENAIKNGDSLAKMRLNCVQEAKKYHVDNVLPKLLKEIGITINTD